MRRTPPQRPSLAWSCSPRAHIAALTLVALVTLTACSAQTDGMPSAWAPVSKGVDASCPNIDGRHERWVTEGGPDPIFPALFGPKMPSAERAMQWTEFTIRSDGERGFTAEVEFSDGSVDTVQVARGSDYQCRDGWLVAPVSYGVIDGEADVPRDQLALRPDTREVAIARGREQSLVARLETRQEYQLDLWCGDGCKGVKLPWKTKRAVVWSRLLATVDPAEIAAGEDATAPSLSDSLRVAQLAKRGTPPGVRLLSVQRAGTSWRLRYQAARDVEREALLDELLTTPWFVDVTDETVDGATLPDGSLRVIVSVRLKR